MTIDEVERAISEVVDGGIWYIVRKERAISIDGTLTSDQLRKIAKLLDKLPAETL